MDEQLYKGVLLSHKKELITDTFNNMYPHVNLKIIMLSERS